MGCSKRSSKKEADINTSLPQETRKNSNNLILYIKEQQQRIYKVVYIHKKKWTKDLNGHFSKR